MKDRTELHKEVAATRTRQDKVVGWQIGLIVTVLVGCVALIVQGQYRAQAVTNMAETVDKAYGATILLKDQVLDIRNDLDKHREESNKLGKEIRNNRKSDIRIESKEKLAMVMVPREAVKIKPDEARQELGVLEYDQIDVDVVIKTFKDNQMPRPEWQDIIQQ